MAAKHPAIKAELGQIERSLEQYAKTNEVEPGDDLRDKIMYSLVTNLGDDRNFRAKETQEAKIIPLQRPQTNFYKYAFAACLALLLVSVFALVNMYNRLQDSNNLVASLQGQSRQKTNTEKQKDGENGVLRDPTFKMLKLN